MAVRGSVASDKDAVRISDTSNATRNSSILVDLTKVDASVCLLKGIIAIISMNDGDGLSFQSSRPRLLPPKVILGNTGGYLQVDCTHLVITLITLMVTA